MLVIFCLNLATGLHIPLPMPLTTDQQEIYGRFMTTFRAYGGASYHETLSILRVLQKSFYAAGFKSRISQCWRADWARGTYTVLIRPHYRLLLDDTFLDPVIEVLSELDAALFTSYSYETADEAEDDAIKHDRNVFRREVPNGGCVRRLESS